MNGPSFPALTPAAPAPELGASAATIVAVTALDDIRDALDSDCDETCVALYNPRRTVAKIRAILERADQQLEQVAR